MQRKTEAEITRELRQQHFDDYEIFMAQALAVGHDKRANKIYQRNENGEILLFPPDATVAKLDVDAYDQASVRYMQPSKKLDDDSPLIAQEFLSWKNEAALGW